MRRLVLAAVMAFAGAAWADAAPTPPPTAPELLAASKPQEWRRLDPENLLYVELPSGRVTIELAPAFAPRTIANIKALARKREFDGLSVVRVQDNYVAQWGAGDEAQPAGPARPRIPAEFDRSAAGLPFDRLRDPDVYAPQVGFSGGFRAARDPVNGRAWLTHCYGTVAVARGTDADSGDGSQLYVVIGHAPRHLDRNTTVVGRVIEGVDRLSSLPRGTGSLGFYKTPAERTPIRSIRVAADLPESERTAFEALRTDAPTFAAITEDRRSRLDAWYKSAPGRVDLCNVALPIRRVPPTDR
jgi:peptidylprolyl isomerase